MTRAEEEAIRELYQAMTRVCLRIILELEQREEAERDARPRP